MKKHITKLDSDKLLEVSGGMEKNGGISWARQLGPIDPKSGKPEKQKTGDIPSETEKTDDDSEES